MPKTRNSRVKGAYHYAKRRDGTKYRVYHSGARGKGSYGKYAKRSAYKTSKRPSSRYGTITGYGTYYGTGRAIRSGTQVPKVKNSKGGFCIQHKEFIGDIPASQAFTLASLPINPGQKDTFPWLSQIAENFEEWVPKGIIFHFKSTSSNAVVSTNANAALGAVIMATEYNVINPVFGNKQQMENYEGAVSCDPSKNMTHFVESSKTHNPLGVYFVRTGSVPEGSDQRFYDMGLFQIASTGMQANQSVIGELWVSYDIELKKPRMLTGNPADNEPACDHFNLPITGILPAKPFGDRTSSLIEATTGSNLGGYVSGGIVAKAAQPRGGVIPVLDGNGDPTGAFGDSTANTYYFPDGVTRGLYQVTYLAVYGTAGSAIWSPTITPFNCAIQGIINSGVTAGLANNGTAGVTTTMLSFFIKINKGYAKMVLAGVTGTFANPTYADWIVSQVPEGLN